MAGIIDIGTAEHWIYIWLKAAQDLVGVGDVVSQIGAKGCRYI